MEQECCVKLLMFIIWYHYALVQGDPDIPFKVTVNMNISLENIRTMEEYTKLVNNAVQGFLDSLKTPSDDKEVDYETEFSIDDVNTIILICY